MTYEELKKVPFHFVSHMSLEKEHRSMYMDDSGRLGFCDITKKKGEFEFGKSKRVFRIGNTWHETKDFSDTDKKTAENFGIDYMDVIELILRYTIKI